MYKSGEIGGEIFVPDSGAIGYKKKLHDLRSSRKDGFKNTVLSAGLNMLKIQEYRLWDNCLSLHPSEFRIRDRYFNEGDTCVWHSRFTFLRYATTMGFSTFLHQELFNIEISSSPMLDSGQNFDEGGTHVWHSRFTFLRDTTSFRVLVKISTRVTW
jgi:hypothetical protein